MKNRKYCISKKNDIFNIYRLYYDEDTETEKEVIIFSELENEEMAKKICEELNEAFELGMATAFSTF